MSGISSVRTGVTTALNDQYRSNSVGDRSSLSQSTNGTVARTPDSVELSSDAQMSVLLDRVKNDSPVRSDLVQQVKLQIANGTYQSTDKLSKALDSALNDMSTIFESLSRGTTE